MEVLQAARTDQRLNCQLGELHLPRNNISVHGLRHLAYAIRLAGPWLKDVNVSHNQVSVRTAEDRTAWEDFLDAFGACQALRRLDMSHNDFTGTPAFEILTRVYFRHPPYDPSLARPGQIDLDDSEGQPAAELPTALENLTIDRGLRGYKEYEGRGLRYVPYLVLSNVNMDDSGCFLLSYILERHVEPRHLLEPLKAGPVKQQLDNYDQQSGCSGIIYTTEGLSHYASKLLTYCEQQRAELVQAEVQEEACGSSEQGTPPRDERPPTPPSAVGIMLAPRHKYGTPRRRSSIVSGDSGKAAAAAVASRKGSSFDPESVRWKLHRETIEKHGLHSVELWHTAMRLLRAARTVFTPVGHGSPSVSTHPSATALLMTPPRKITPPTAIKQGRQDSVVTTHTTGSDSDNEGGRDERMPFQLPLKIWARILADAVDPRDILSDTQVRNVLAYAMDRATLAKELESVRNPESNQKWMIIDAMGCLAYEMPL